LYPLLPIRFAGNIPKPVIVAGVAVPPIAHIPAAAVQGKLWNWCLSLHSGGVRYCFKKDPNVTKLIEDAEQEVARDPDTIRQWIDARTTAGRQGRGDSLDGFVGGIGG
ncbi:MAG TPA: hypothetical protein PK777_17030, partial [Thermoguttaceae bacterium]|nr:hypothetical protein [Thermoguttaceae bacterium]